MGGRKTLRTAAIILVALIAGGWLFCHFALDQVITTVARRKVGPAVATSSHGKYAVHFTHFRFADGTLTVNGLELQRTGFGVEERGATVDALHIDSLRVTGVSWLDIALGRPIAAGNVTVSHPTLYLCDAAEGRARTKSIPPDTASHSDSSSGKTISIANIMITDLACYFPGQGAVSKGNGNGSEGAFAPSVATYIRASGLKYDPSKQGMAAVQTERVEFDIPRFQYGIPGGDLLTLRNALGDTRDSTITIDSFEYRPMQSVVRKKEHMGRPISIRRSPTRKDERMRNTPDRSGTSFGGRGVRIAGIQVERAMAGKGAGVRSISVGSWNADIVRSDGSARRPATRRTSQRTSTHGSPSIKLPSQAALARSISFPIAIGEVQLPRGNLRLRQRSNMGTFSTLLDTHGIEFHALDIRLGPGAGLRPPPLFSKEIELRIPDVDYHDGGSALRVRSFYTNTRTGRLDADSIHYSAAGAEAECRTLRLSGTDYEALCNGAAVNIQQISLNQWSIVSIGHRSGDSTDSERTAGMPSGIEHSSETASSGGHASTGQLFFGHVLPIAFPITIHSLDISEGEVRVQEQGTDDTTTWVIGGGAAVGVGDIRWQPKATPPMAIGSLYFSVPAISYEGTKSFYRFLVSNVHGNSATSAVTIDSLGYHPKYSKDEFAERHQYARGRTDFECGGLRLTGIDFSTALMGTSTVIDTIAAASWSIDYYKDYRKPSDPNPKPSTLINEMVSRVQAPLTVGCVLMENGRASVSEQDKNIDSAGRLTFDSITVRTGPLSLDSANDISHRPTAFDLTGVFLDECRLAARCSYALRDTAFELTIDDDIGHLDALRLNSYLVPCPRYEVLSGTLDSGHVHMEVVHGVATTTATPIYHDFRLKLLPLNPEDSPGLKEAVKTFIANDFIIHRNNPRESGGAPVSATTTRPRPPTETLFQFIWLALRQSLEKVIR